MLFETWTIDFMYLFRFRFIEIFLLKIDSKNFIKQGKDVSENIL